MRDKWTEISSEAYDHTTFMMPIPGGALIRHVKRAKMAMSGVGLFCAQCRWQDSLQSSQFSNS